MSHLDLGLLRSLVAVVDAGGFTSAEKKLHRTQSTISQQLKRLEEQLGVKLLLRSREGVTPTEEGERVLAYARRLLALQADMAAEIGAGRQRTVLRLGMTDDFAQLYLDRLLKMMRTALPDVQLRVTCDLSVHLKRNFARGDFDLVIYKRTTSSGPGRRIEREPIHWVVAKNYRHDPALPLPLVLFPAGCVYRQRALAMLESQERPWSLAFESPSTVSVQAAVNAGLGIALFTPSSTPRECLPLRTLPALGNADLVYELGASSPAETRAALNRLLALVRAQPSGPARRISTRRLRTRP